MTGGRRPTGAADGEPSVPRGQAKALHALPEAQDTHQRLPGQ